MNQNQHHRVKPIHLYYDAAKKYNRPIQSETGARLKYDIKELRLHPGKLTQWAQEQKKGKKRMENRMNNMARANWETAKSDWGRRYR